MTEFFAAENVAYQIVVCLFVGSVVAHFLGANTAAKDRDWLLLAVHVMALAVEYFAPVALARPLQSSAGLAVWALLVAGDICAEVTARAEGRRDPDWRAVLGIAISALVDLAITLAPTFIGSR